MDNVEHGGEQTAGADGAALRASGSTETTAHTAGHRLKPVLPDRGQGEVAAAGLPLNDSQLTLKGRHRREQGSRTPGVRAALLALDFYKLYLSPWLAGSCRYAPTCSRYAYEAIERFGLARGVWLGTKRLLRCHPFTKRFGYDPVPEKWEEMRSDTRAKHVEGGRGLSSSGPAEERPLHGRVRS
jgi:uncharacterized protein